MGKIPVPGDPGGAIPLPSGGRIDFAGPAAGLSPALVMAVVNCTGDSFYPGSRNRTPGEAAGRALEAAAAGAAIIDFGGESTRPGAEYVSEEEEIRRVIPALTAFRRRCSAAVSVDTRKAAVARAALDAGADIINDISALEDDPLLGPLCARRGAPVVLMHKQGIPRSMQERPRYGDTAGEVAAYLTAAARRAEDCGIPRGHIILDPGFGFGKTLDDNLNLLARLAEICGPGYPVLAGLSRKAFVGEITGKGAGDRLYGTLAANAAALFGGAAILRVHDVPETADLVKVIHAIRMKGWNGFSGLLRPII
jgi:dihydropteroate synthase